MHFTRKQLGIPYILFLILFVVLPLFVVLYYAFTDGQGQFTVENFQHFFTNGKTLGTLFYSFVIALLTTTVCLFIAYPTAYILARGGFRKPPAFEKAPAEPETAPADVDQFYTSYHGTQRSVKPDRG